MYFNAGLKEAFSGIDLLITGQAHYCCLLHLRYLPAHASDLGALEAVVCTPSTHTPLTQLATTHTQTQRTVLPAGKVPHKFLRAVAVTLAENAYRMMIRCLTMK